MAYDDTNVFAKILRGELPSHKIYEDAETFAFMDIMPRGDGHCLVIPKQPSRNLLDADAASIATLITCASVSPSTKPSLRRMNSIRNRSVPASTR